MSRSFWDNLFATEGRERFEALEAVAEANNENTDYRFRQLSQRLEAQDRTIKELRVAVKVLIDVLAESKAVEPEALRSRIDMTLEALTAPQASGPYRGAAGSEAAAPAEPEEGCCRCFKGFPRSKLNVTLSGPMCDRCFHAAGL